MNKKIVGLILFLLSLIPSCVFAFEPPQPPRWLWVDSTDMHGGWIDSETLKYYKTYEYSHNGHRCVNYWVMYYMTEDNTHSLERVVMDFDCRATKTISIAIYNDKNEMIDSYRNEYSSFTDIIPGTFAEAEYDILKVYWEIFK